MTAPGPSRARIRWGGASDRGRRREENQDSLYADADLFVVADGMGGHSGGSVASNLAVKTLAANSPSTRPELLAAVQHANEVVLRRANAHAFLKGMGTTLCAMAVVNGDCGPEWCLVNVGDSRAYRHRAGQLVQLTCDHNFVAEMVRAGDLSVSDAAAHPRRNTLTRAVGVEQEVNVDAWTFDVTGGDRFLLCTDGVTNELTEAEIGALLGSGDPTASARAMVQRANDRGGSDNATALVVDVTVDDTDGDSAAADGTHATGAPNRGGRQRGRHSGEWSSAGVATDGDGGGDSRRRERHGGENRRRGSRRDRKQRRAERRSRAPRRL